MFSVHGSPSVRTYVSNSASILQTGNQSDLGVGQIGFFKVDKTGVGIPDKALSAPTFQTAPNFKLGIGRKKYPAQSAVQPKVSLFNQLTEELKGRDIIGWRGTKAENEPSTEIYTLGYDGLDASKRINATKDYRELIIQLRFWGTPIRKLTGIRKDLIRQYYISKGCIDKCMDVCEANPGLADEMVVDDLISQIEKDKFNLIPITNFVKVTKLRKSAIADASLTGLIASTKYSISICDDGTSSALGIIQTQYPGFKVKLSSRFGSTSTYTMWRLDSQSAPAAYVNTQPVALAVCNTCPTGYTLVNSTTVYTIERPITPTTDLTTSGTRQTFADSIGTAYAADTRGVATLTGAAGSGYTNGTYVINATGGGGTGAIATIVIAGGAITTRTITAKGRGYTSVPTFTLPGGVGAGTGGTVVATISAAPTVTSSFVSSDGGTATVFVTSPVAFNSPLASDVVSSTASSEYCTPPAGSNVSWTSIATSTRAPKQYMITLGDSVCGTSRLTELQGAYPELVIAEQGTTGNCARIYITTTYSNPVQPDACSIVSYKYSAPDGFQRNSYWTEYVAPLVNPVCTTEEEADVCVAAGVKFETAAFNHDYSECVYGYYSFDMDDVDPVYMEISAHTQDWTASPCYITDQVVTKLRGTKFATGSGKFIRIGERSTLQREGFIWTTNPAHNEAYGVEFAAQPNLFYDTYHLTFETNHNMHGIVGKSGISNQTTYTFAFPSGTGKAFERLVNGYVLSLGKDELQAVVL